jgi:flagellin-like hook-associated protein FlgL
MGDITLSQSVRQNLLALQNTSELLARTQDRLATGNKVNSALDNPTNFFTASALNSRASDIGRLLDSVANGVQTLRAADTGIKSITKLVENAQATARQALQAPKGEYEYQRAEILGTVGLGDDTAAQAQGTGYVAPDKSVSRGAKPLDLDKDIDVIQGTVGATADTTLADLGILDGDTFTIDINGAGAVTVSFETAPDGTAGDLEIDADTTIEEFIATFNASALVDGVTLRLDGGRLTFEGDDPGDTFDIAVDAGTPLTTFGVTAGASATVNSALAGLAAAGETLTISDGTNDTVITFGAGAGEVQSVQALLDEINAGAADVTADLDADGNLVITRNDGAQSADPLTITGGAAMSTLGLEATSTLESPTISALQDKKLTIAINDGTTIEFTFGVKAGQISSQEELQARLQEIDGIDDATTLFTGGLLALNADGTADKFRLGGDEDVLAALGLERMTYSSGNDDLADLMGRTIEVSVGTRRKTISFGPDAGIGQVNSIAELTKVLAEIGAIVTTEPDGSGGSFLSITTDDENEGKNITIAPESDQYALSRLGLQSGTTEATVTAIIDYNQRRASLETDFNDLLKQIDALAQDASYNGVNLLDLDDLSVIFNENGTSRLDVTGVNFKAEGLGLVTVTPNDFQDDNKLNKLLGMVEGALDRLRSQASKFGSQLSVVETRQNFSKELINVLETGAANLTLADINQEGANLTALQTRQQLSTTALSLAAQADQNVLQLIRG